MQDYARRNKTVQVFYYKDLQLYFWQGILWFYITWVYYAQHSIRVDEKSSALVYVRLGVLALVFSLSYCKLHLYCLFKSKENVLSGWYIGLFGVGKRLHFQIEQDEFTY